MSDSELISKLIESGLKLPYYEYEVKQFAADFLENSFPNGIIKTAYFNTFNEACEFILSKMNIN